MKKMDLAAAVRKFRNQVTERRDSGNEDLELALAAKSESEDPPSSIPREDPILTTIRSVWARVLGLDRGELKPATSIASIADSLTMMQARQSLQKHGLHVSLADLTDNPTVASQAALFRIRDSLSGVPASPPVPRPREGPPTSLDMVEASGDDSIAAKIACCAAPVLARYGLDWQMHVEDVLPMYDILANMAAVRRRLRSAMRRDAFWVNDITASQMIDVLKRALAEHPALRSMWFPTSSTSVSQLVVRPTELGLAPFVSATVHTVDTPEDLAMVWAGEDVRDVCDSQIGPGALFRVAVFNIRSQPHAAGFIYWSNHAAFDATSLSYFWETLDELVTGRSSSTLTPRTEYKLWVDAYYAGQASAHAHAGAREFSRRLKGFATWSANSIVPRPRAPGFMSGNDDHWIDVTTGKPGDPALRSPLDGEQGMAIGNKGLTRLYTLPGLQHLQTTHGIPAHTLLKAALALANTLWTHSDSAFFRSLQSGRRWPFMNPRLAAHLPSAADVAGPTFQASCDVVHFLPDRSETVGELLRRLKRDQEIATRYEHTPLSLALAALCDADRDALMERGLSQLFNFLPGNVSGDDGMRSGGSKSRLQQVQSEMNADTGLQWDFTLRGPGRVGLFVRWDGCQLGRAEVEGMCEDFGEVVGFLAGEGSLGRRLREFAL